MPKRMFRRLTLAAAFATYALVLLGGAARSISAMPGLAVAERGVAVLVAVLAAVALGGAQAYGQPRIGLMAGMGLTVAAAVGALFAPAGALGMAPAMLAACAATWLVSVVYGGGDEPYHSRLSMFRSQWQMPLYAAMAAAVVTLLGGYLKAVGGGVSCAGWPLCADMFQNWNGIMLLHLVHRTAAGLAGLLLLYTVAFVWRRHANRPLLLVLTGIAVVLYTTEVILGAEAARGALTAAGAVLHLSTATALICTLVSLSAMGYYAPSLPVIAGAEVALPLPAERSFSEVARDYFMLTKPRILVLLLITGYAAMWVADRGLPNLALTAVTLLGLGMSCGAANAINMWWDRDIDAVMKRTQKRPLPGGRLTPAQVLGFGVMTGALSFVLLAAAVNLLTAVLSLAGLLFYVCIYTMWLKRSTTQNIVIGGAAGAVPPLVGWAAVTGNVSWASVIMFLIVFMWTPPHFWALALFRNEDYRRANVPMLPVIKGEMHTKWQILLYSVLMIPSTAALYWTGTVGQIYLWVSTLLGVTMVGSSLLLLRERLPAQKWAVRTFIWSIFWLGLVFTVMVLDVKA